MLLLLLLSRSVVSDSVGPHRQQPTRLPRPWDSPGKNTGVGCHFLLQCMKVKNESEVAQSCLTLSDPMDCSPPDSSIHGIFQARVLEWGATAFSVTGLRQYLTFVSALTWVIHTLYLIKPLEACTEVHFTLLTMHMREHSLEKLGCCCSASKPSQTLCNAMDCSTPGFLYFTISWSLLKLMSVELAMPSNHLILCFPLLLLPSIFPSFRVFQ